jgi:thiamine biosynthesis lipoprotein
VPVDPELFDFIVESMRYYRDSDGAFDVTVGPLMKAWGFFRGEGHVPPASKLEEARRHVGGSKVILNSADRTIRFDHAGVELDLGGIAKGYAVDRVVRLLRARGVRAALVSAGGSTTYGLGKPPGRAGWDVTIQDPVSPQKTALTVRLKDRALSVSGSYGKSFESGGVTYSHIMDPRSGMPVQGMLSVAVMTATGTAGDALDDVFFVLGPEGSRRYLNRFAGADVFYFVADRTQPWRMIHAPAR